MGLVSLRLTHRGKSVWFLAFLAPVIGEMLSGSAPFIEWLNPFTIVTFLGMYGAGAILVREFAVMWDKGWASILILGAAYGMMEEGISVKSFFDPEWIDLGALAEYGRYLGVNWVWTVWLTVYHSMISIGLTLLVFSLWYPQYRGQRLLTDRQFKWVLAIFLADIAITAVAFTFSLSFVPPPSWYLLTIALVVGFYFLAKAVPKNLISGRHERPTWSNASFLVLGFFAFPLMFTTAGSAPEGVHPIIPVIVFMVLCASLLLLLQHKMGARDNDLPKLYLASGMLGFFVLWGFVLEVNGVLSGSVSSIIFIVFIALLVQRVKSYAAPNDALGPINQWRERRKRRRTDSNR